MTGPQVRSVQEILSRLETFGISKPAMYVGFDPGPSTGVAIVDALTLQPLEDCVIECTNYELLRWIFIRTQPQHVVCESFLAYARLPREGAEAIRLEGVVAYLAFCGNFPVTFQPPNTKSSYLWLAKLRYQHWLEGRQREQTATQRHAIDAYAHCLAFARVKPTPQEVEWRRTHPNSN